MKNLYIIIFSLLIALLSAYFENGRDAAYSFRFHTSSDLKEKEAVDIKKAVAQYNTNSASFYSSAGFLAGLEEIPAVPLLKRMLFKDITMLKGQNLVMVFDKDSVEFDEVRFLNSEIAVAHTREVWGVMLQKMDTRKPISTVKGVEVNVRYSMYKGSLRGEEPRWLIFEVAVYPKDEEIPELNIKPAL